MTDREWRRLIAELHPDDAADVTWRYRTLWRDTDPATGAGVIPFDELPDGEQAAWIAHVHRIRVAPESP